MESEDQDLEGKHDKAEMNKIITEDASKDSDRKSENSNKSVSIPIENEGPQESPHLTPEEVTNTDDSHPHDYSAGFPYTKSYWVTSGIFSRHVANAQT